MVFADLTETVLYVPSPPPPPPPPPSNSNYNKYHNNRLDLGLDLRPDQSPQHFLLFAQLDKFAHCLTGKKLGSVLIKPWILYESLQGNFARCIDSFHIMGNKKDRRTLSEQTIMENTRKSYSCLFSLNYK